jgi:uncharacterized membrane-anchored protein
LAFSIKLSRMATERSASKVPEMTLLFWIVKVAATTLGETGGDAVSMSMKLGYLVATALFAALFLVMVAIQIRAKRFRPVVYWLTIIATTTVGTTLADFADRSLGIGYAGGSSLLLALLVVSLVVWRLVCGTVAIASVRAPRAEIFYWVTIMFSQTLGTALGDWTADSAGLGYRGSALVFGGLLLVVAALHFATRISRTFTFWAAFILTAIFSTSRTRKAVSRSAVISRRARCSRSLHSASLLFPAARRAPHTESAAGRRRRVAFHRARIAPISAVAAVALTARAARSARVTVRRRVGVGPAVARRRVASRRRRAAVGARLAQAADADRACGERQREDRARENSRHDPETMSYPPDFDHFR